MANTKVNVFLPKFSVEGDYDLKPLLESLGMTNVFNESASDFSEMCETKGVVLSKIIHKVSLEVNEQGGESLEVPGYRILQHKDEFKADHPFICSGTTKLATWFFQADSVPLKEGILIMKKHNYIYGDACSCKAWCPDYHLWKEI